MSASGQVLPPSEHGDREAFLARLRHRLASGVPENRAHPLPPLGGPVPEPRYRQLDPHDLIGSFERAAARVEVTVHRVAGSGVPESLLLELVERHHVRRAVVSKEPEVAHVGEVLSACGIEVGAYGIEAGSVADLGVTSAVAGIAATGSIVQAADRAGSRGASLLPPTHLCVLPAHRLVATPADVLRPLGDGRMLPSNLLLITGPSRSGDIEQVITLGVHGPTSVHVVLTGA